MPDGLAELTLLQEDISQIVVRPGETGLDPQGLLVLGDGFPDLTRSLQSVPRLQCPAADSGLIRSACSYWAMASSILPVCTKPTPKLLWASA